MKNINRQFVDVDEFLKTTIEEKRFVFQTKDMLNETFIVKTVYSDLAKALYNAALSEKEVFAMRVKVGTIEVPRWIPVTERLPEKAGKYIVCTAKGSVYCTKFYTKRFGTDSNTHITHWMPLPDAPKDGE